MALISYCQQMPGLYAVLRSLLFFLFNNHNSIYLASQKQREIINKFWKPLFIFLLSFIIPAYYTYNKSSYDYDPTNTAYLPVVFSYRLVFEIKG